MEINRKSIENHRKSKKSIDNHIEIVEHLLKINGAFDNYYKCYVTLNNLPSNITHLI